VLRTVGWVPLQDGQAGCQVFEAIIVAVTVSVVPNQSARSFRVWVRLVLSPFTAVRCPTIIDTRGLRDPDRME